jgi:hypothetical protein
MDNSRVKIFGNKPEGRRKKDQDFKWLEDKFEDI